MSTIPFAASLISPTTGSTDVTASNNCMNLIIGDDSNYSTNNDPATAYSLFTSYRTVLLTYYQGNNYPLSSVANPPTCNAAYAGSNPSFALTTGDGWYQIQLSTLPNWASTSIPYIQQYHQVYNVFDGNVYTCIASNTSSSGNRPDLSPTLWQLVLPANIPTTLFSRYTASGFFALTCGASVGLPIVVSNALCETDGCNTASFCKNPAFIKAAIAFLCFYSIQNANAQNQIQFTSATFDVLNSIVSCPQPNTQDFSQGNSGGLPYPQPQ